MRLVTRGKNLRVLIFGDPSDQETRTTPRYCTYTHPLNPALEYRETHHQYKKGDIWRERFFLSTAFNLAAYDGIFSSERG